MIFLKFIILISCFTIFIQTCSSQSSQLSLEEKVTELTKLTSKKPIIRLNLNKWENLVKSTPRNYTVIIMFTALSKRRQCKVCRDASDEFTIVANSFIYSFSFTKQLFFAIVDFDEGSEIFQQLNLNSAPIFVHIPPTSHWTYDIMDIQRIGFKAETIAKWISEKSSIQIRVLRSPNFTGIILAVIFFGYISTVLYIRRNNLEFIYNRTSWGIISLFIVFLMTSGQMWNHIRGPPLMQKTSKGSVYVHNSTSAQFVIETYIVIIYNAAIVIGMILINEALKNRADQKKKKFMIIIGLILTAIFFSALISIFRVKAHGYPYSFLFK